MISLSKKVREQENDNVDIDRGEPKTGNEFERRGRDGIPGFFKERESSHVRKSLKTKPINPSRTKNGKATKLVREGFRRVLEERRRRCDEREFLNAPSFHPKKAITSLIDPAEGMPSAAEMRSAVFVASHGQ